MIASSHEVKKLKQSHPQLALRNEYSLLHFKFFGTTKQIELPTSA